MSKRFGSSKTSLSSASNNNLRQVASAKLTFNSDQTNNNDTHNLLLNKEEEYKRLNAELEKKTANLVYEAEQVLKANEKLIGEANYLDKISDMDFLNVGDDVSSNAPLSGSNYKAVINKAKLNLKSNLIDMKELSKFKQKIENLQQIQDNENEEEDFNRITEYLSNNPTPDNFNLEIQGNKNSAMSYNLKRNYNEDEKLKELVSKISSKDEDALESNLIPRSANEMSSDAQIRFLKAKLKVMQEEMERYGSDLNRKEEENLKLAQRCKDLDEDRAKQLRISNSHQTQMEKFKKQNEELQLKLNAQEVQIQALKKENDTMKKDFKKQQIDQQQVDLRLNRALEEIEKYKQQLQKTSSSSRDQNEQEKRRVEQLQSDNKRLQKQKLELIQAFKKQLKLIDILKKQKMHLEAAKLLQFSEEEFINALEWNSANQHAEGGINPFQNSNRSSGRPPSGSKPRTIKQNNQVKLSTEQQPKVLVASRSLGGNLNNLKEITNENMLENNQNDEEDFEEYDENIEDDLNQFDYFNSAAKQEAIAQTNLHLDNLNFDEEDEENNQEKF